jgi:hypothetical protein
MRTVILLITLSFASVPVVGFAQDGGDKTKFYNFDDLLIDGQYKKPQVLYTDARQKVKFERLLKLKKDFLPKLKATAKDATLR